jgi:hypothetical protein
MRTDADKSIFIAVLIEQMPIKIAPASETARELDIAMWGKLKNADGLPEKTIKNADDLACFFLKKCDTLSL